ncbi:hypothetical protein HNP46_005786 [Pseudomonas nitritireducens]|uniref:Uncharacterized protein n=1 Tax=Pseudomonas nitroreducens TaxID=46680 RepID=A0A7W7KQ19_PSENT|nr:hypothetical protein [Pseudomonas nitritireducens]MBB4866879.1 hypothetical protein [Pseudomonas nitritireducens]
MIRNTKAEQRSIVFEAAPLIDLLKPPKTVLEAAKEPEFFGTREGIANLPAPFNTGEWVSCSMVEPHRDIFWSGRRFVLLVLESSHTVSVMKSMYRGLTIPTRPGMLFTINPTQLHWCWPDNGCFGSPFIALHWDVATREIDGFIDKLVAHIREITPLIEDGVLE